MKNQPRVAAIIPAYNEEQTIAEVVAAAKESPLLHEVIVVCDGSSDGTAAKAKAAGAEVLILPVNHGKGGAMLHALTHTDAGIILFMDADLKGLTADHIERLLLPVINNSKFMNVGIRDRGPFWSWLAQYLPLIGGERAMVRQVIEGIDPNFVRGFMVESALNYHCRANHWDYGTVFLPGLSIRHKYEKVGWVTGLIQYFKMTAEVARAMLQVRLARIRHEFPVKY